MKHLKNAIYFIFFLTVLVSCEKETIYDNEIQVFQKSEKIEVLSRIGNFDWIYRTKTEFDNNCSGDFSYEDFVASSPNASCAEGFSHPLSNATAIGPYLIGDIVSGVVFSAIPENYGLSLYNINGNCSSNSDPYLGSDILTTNGECHIQVEFTEDNINAFSVNLFNAYGNGNCNIQVYNNLDEQILVSSETISKDGSFRGVTTSQFIKKVIFHFNSCSGGIDDLYFGFCYDPDYDGDGLLNENDPFPNSNMSEEISIGGNYLDIENVFVKPGTTMMDQIDALIEKMNELYNGDNYNYVHKKFTSELAKITYYWYKDRLITSRERSAISSAAWRANVPSNMPG